MMKIIVFLLIGLFFYNKDIISLNILEGINIWYKNLFPSIFPVLILSDLLLSIDINSIIKYLGKIMSKIFKVSSSGILVLLTSLIAGTPSNFAIASSLYKNNLLSQEDINKLLTICLLFNPLFIIKFTSFKCYIILIISNLITGFLLRNYNPKIVNNNQFTPIKFNLNNSIEKNMKILINILGTITVFMVLANIIIIKKELVLCIFAGIMEITTGLYKTNIFFKGNIYLYLLITSFGGLSILNQVKGVLSPIKIDYRLFIKSRILCFIISIFICLLT